MYNLKCSDQQTGRLLPKWIIHLLILFLRLTIINASAIYDNHAVDTHHMSKYYPVATINGTNIVLDWRGRSKENGIYTVLMDTTRERSLDWAKYSNAKHNRMPGWVEESFTNFDNGINWRSYVVCDVAYQDVNNWLWTPFIERRNANRLYIEVKFSMRDCNLFPGRALNCKETFSLFYHETDFKNRPPPSTNEIEKYKLIDRIAADEGRATFTSEVIINTEVRNVPVSKKGVYFAIRDQGACISLLAIKIYYVSCPNVTLNFARFPETPTGAELTAIVPTRGICVENAVEIDSPRLLCQADGNWTLPSGACKCMAGYEPIGQTCQVCQKGTFKAQIGDEPCLACPLHSTTLYRGSIECRCEHGWYRAEKDPKHYPCTQPASAPQHLTVGYVDQNVVMLTWQPPKYLGGRNDLVYRIQCDLCVGVTYSPGKSSLNQTKVTISNLNPSTTYTIQVFAENGVSDRELAQFAEIKVTTESSGFVSMVVSEEGNGNSNQINNPSNAGNLLNARVIAVGETDITFGWDFPEELQFDNPKCEVRYYEHLNVSQIRNQLSNGALINVEETSNNEIVLSRLKASTEYAMQVRCRTNGGFWTDYTRPIYQVTGQAPGVQIIPSLNIASSHGLNNVNLNSGIPTAVQFNNSLPSILRPHNPAFISDLAGTNHSNISQVRVIAGICVAIVVAIIVAIAMIAVYLRRSSDECNKKQPSDCDTLEYTRNGEVISSMEHPPIVPTVNLKSLDLINSPFSVTTLLFPNGTNRSYIDPNTYEDVGQAIREFTREIDANYIHIDSIIGGGEFGDVCKGSLKQPGRGEIIVAIKTLKHGATDKARMDFLTEASIMGQFDHPNVIYLQGVVTKTNPVMIITEFMDNGSLDTFLRTNHAKFQILQLVNMMRGIAYGMQYLSEIHYVHRDLAARNVLVNAALVCKIADFGLSREIESANEGAYTTKSQSCRIPVRWTAPEAIAFRKFTSASDVWSYGICIWEILTHGERPYWSWSNQDVIKGIEKGYRLPAPMNCPQALYQLMLDCWQKDRAMRPTFSQIVKKLDRLMTNPEYLQIPIKTQQEYFKTQDYLHQNPEYIQKITWNQYHS